jgi:hypothetical protein
LRKTIGNKEAERKLEAVYDTLWGLKTTAGQLDDENRKLRKELRFKSNDFEFRHPFWFEKGNDQVALCPKCFADHNAAQMSKPMGSVENGMYRKCLVCSTITEETQGQARTPEIFEWDDSDHVY